MDAADGMHQPPGNDLDEVKEEAEVLRFAEN